MNKSDYFSSVFSHDLSRLKQVICDFDQEIGLLFVFCQWALMALDIVMPIEVLLLKIGVEFNMVESLLMLAVKK